MTDKIGSSATADKKRKVGSAMPAKKGARSNIIAKNPGKGADTKTMANKDPASPMKSSAVTRKGVRAMAGKDLAPTVLQQVMTKQEKESGQWQARTQPR